MGTNLLKKLHLNKDTDFKQSVRPRRLYNLLGATQRRYHKKSESSELRVEHQEFDFAKDVKLARISGHRSLLWRDPGLTG